MAVVSLEAAVGAAAFVLASWVWAQLALRSLALSPPLWPQSLSSREKLLTYIIRMFLGSSTEVKLSSSGGMVHAQHRQHHAGTEATIDPLQWTAASTKVPANKGQPLSVWGPLPDGGVPKWSAFEAPDQFLTFANRGDMQDVRDATEADRSVLDASIQAHMDDAQGALAGLSSLGLLQFRGRGERADESNDAGIISRRTPSRGEPEPEEEGQVEDVLTIAADSGREGAAKKEENGDRGEGTRQQSDNLGNQVDVVGSQGDPNARRAAEWKGIGSTKEKAAWEHAGRREQDLMQEASQEQDKKVVDEMLHARGTKQKEGEHFNTQSVEQDLEREGVRRRKVAKDEACGNALVAAALVAGAQPEVAKPTGGAASRFQNVTLMQPSTVTSATELPKEGQWQMVDSTLDVAEAGAKEVRSGGEDSSSILRPDDAPAVPTAVHTGTVLLPQAGGLSRPAVLLARGDPITPPTTITVASHNASYTASSSVGDAPWTNLGEACIVGQPQRPCQEKPFAEPGLQKPASHAVRQKLPTLSDNAPKPSYETHAQARSHPDSEMAEVGQTQRIDILHLIQERAEKAESGQKVDKNERPNQTEKVARLAKIETASCKASAPRKAEKDFEKHLMRPPPLVSQSELGDDSANDDALECSELPSQTDCAMSPAAASFASASPSPASVASCSSASSSVTSSAARTSVHPMSPASSASSSCWTAASSSGGAAAAAAALAAAKAKARSKKAAAPWKPSLRLGSDSTSSGCADPGQQVVHRWSFYS